MKTLYRASRVVTFSHPPEGEWLLVDGRHVERAGSGDPPAEGRTVDLPGATIIPGFNDTHVHLTGTGLQHAGPDLSNVGSAAGLLQALSRTMEGRETAVLVHGFDETKWSVPSLPTLADLDALSSRPLIAVRADGHISIANTQALTGSGALDLPGAERDETGVPTGVARQEANDRLQTWFHETLREPDIREYQIQAASLAAGRGITCVHEMAMPRARGPRDFETLAGHLPDLPVDVVPYVATTDIPYVVEFGLPRIGGDLFVDGSIGARTARVGVPYADGEGQGRLYFGDDDLAEFFHNAHLAGLQAAVHAIGDAAIEQVLRVWERVYGALDSRQRRHFRATRHRIEHFEMPDAGQIERAAVLGLAMSVQPAFDALWGHAGGMYELRLGPDRARRMNPFRTLLRRGMEVGAGSDSPVTPLDPWYGISALERHHDPAGRVRRDEALYLFTSGAARLAHLEEKKARLGPGMHADFAAYDVDPRTADAAAAPRPVLTVSLGREVYAG